MNVSLLPKRLRTRENSHGYLKKSRGSGKRRAVWALEALPAEVADCVVTSPPYYWQRDLGSRISQAKKTPSNNTCESRSRLSPSPTGPKKTGVMFLVSATRTTPDVGGLMAEIRSRSGEVSLGQVSAVDRPGMGLPRKSLIGIPWRVALALQKDGWVLRSAVTWRKPKGLAEPSVRDRPWNTSDSSSS